MSGLRSRAGAYLALTRLGFDTTLVYRTGYLVDLVGVLLQIYLLRVVWTSVYAGRSAVDGVELGAMITFSTLAVLQHTLLRPWNFSSIPQRVWMGMVAVDLSRPVPFPNQALATQLGSTAAQGILIGLALPFALLVGESRPPASPVAGVAFAASLFLAFLVGQALSIIIGLTSFWTVQTSGALIVYRFVEQFLSGALVPLWFMPGTLRAVAAALPFHTMVNTPLAIYLGQDTGGEVVRSLLVQAGWLLVLWLLAWLVWSRALRRVVVHGG